MDYTLLRSRYKDFLIVTERTGMTWYYANYQKVIEEYNMVEAVKRKTRFIIFQFYLILNIPGIFFTFSIFLDNTLKGKSFIDVVFIIGAVLLLSAATYFFIWSLVLSQYLIIYTIKCQGKRY